MARIGIIGGGFSGLSAACYSANAGHEVTLFEKNPGTGGRARSFSEAGFTFDMGPSWYWMPDVFENFFSDFGHSVSDHYELIKLSPSFQIFFKDQEALVVPSELEELYALFESIEQGSASRLRTFLKEGELKYKVSMASLIYKPAHSWREYATYEVLSSALRTDIFKSMKRYVRTFFKDERLISLMEFPVIFLGAMPDKIPALYSLMNYAAFGMGTWYPKKGMAEITKAMQALATSLGVNIRPDTAIEEIIVTQDQAAGLRSANATHHVNAVIASADYHHVEQHLLKKEFRNYDAPYWEKRIMAPSSLIFYLGVSKKIRGLLHHNLFFDTDFQAHASQIYESPQWPAEPLFYVCCPSKTDETVAPAGMENIFILIPLAAGLKDNKELHREYFEKVMSRLEKRCGEPVRKHIVLNRSYCIDDFTKDYNAYKGNAYGLANTLGQTAIFKPAIKNKKVRNLFYTGQLTVPGPGVPPAIISGKIAAVEMDKYLRAHSKIKV